MIFQMTYNNFEMLLMVFMPNITANHAISYTNITYPLLNIFNYFNEVNHFDFDYTEQINI